MMTNDIIFAVAILSRTYKMLDPNTRVPIRRDTLSSIKNNVGMCLEKIMGYTNESLILMPLTEVDKLIETVAADSSFKETPAEVKSILVNKVSGALDMLNLFAGKFYIKNEFDYNPGLFDVVRGIVDSCVKQGFYFGYENE